ncbi:MAG: hypothetical protein RL076_1947 [Chloroflexota bacterium]
MHPYDGADYGRISCAPTMRRITGEYHAPRRCGGLRANIIRPYDAQGLRANIMHPDDAADYGRISCAPTMRRITGGMVLNILPPVVQNGLNIPREGAFLAQGRINTPPYNQRVASISVGIVIIHNS